MTKPEIIHPDDERLNTILKDRFWSLVALYVATVTGVLLSACAMFTKAQDTELEIAKVNAPYIAKYIAADMKERDARSKAWGP